MRVLALDIGGTKIAAALVTGDQLTQRTQLATPQHNMASAMEQTLAQLLSDMPAVLTALPSPVPALSIKAY